MSVAIVREQGGDRGCSRVASYVQVDVSWAIGGAPVLVYVCESVAVSSSTAVSGVSLPFLIAKSAARVWSYIFVRSALVFRIACSAVLRDTNSDVNPSEVSHCFCGTPLAVRSAANAMRRSWRSIMPIRLRGDVPSAISWAIIRSAGPVCWETIASMAANMLASLASSTRNLMSSTVISFWSQ